MSEQPEILDITTEHEVLYQRLCREIERRLRVHIKPDVTVADAADAIAATVVTLVLRSCRVMSARQLAVVLARVPDRGISYVIREPPQYTADEIADVQ